MKLVALGISLQLVCLVRCHYYYLSDSTISSLRFKLRQMMLNSGTNYPLMAGCMRLAFHDCVGGVCDGCIDLSNPDNAGLDFYIKQLDAVDRYYYGGITKADLWALCAVEAAYLGAEFVPVNPATGIKAKPNIKFRYGRLDNPGPCPYRCLPSSTENPVNYILHSFPKMNSDAELAVALMGAHTLGKTHYHNSGFYTLPWTRFPYWLDNEYFKLMVDQNQYWTQYSSQKDYKVRYQWLSADYRYIMLHADMHLYTSLDVPYGSQLSFCFYPKTYWPSCGISSVGQYVQQFAKSNELFIEKFSKALEIMINTGNEYRLKY